jgi:hypothetical protein
MKAARIIENWKKDMSVELWIQQQTDADRLSELAMTVRDDYVTSRDSFDMMETRMELCYVGAE